MSLENAPPYFIFVGQHISDPLLLCFLLTYVYYVYEYVCVCVYVCVCIYLILCMYMYVCVYVYRYVYVCVIFYFSLL